MRDKTTRTIALGLGATLCMTLPAACGRDDYYIVFERVELRGTERVSGGAGCVMVLDRAAFGGSSVSSGGGSADGDLTVDEGTVEDGYHVVVSSQGEELARRDYDRAFLLSHDVDIFEVTTHAGKRFEFLYRGSTECDITSSATETDERLLPPR